MTLPNIFDPDSKRHLPVLDWSQFVMITCWITEPALSVPGMIFWAYWQADWVILSNLIFAFLNLSFMHFNKKFLWKKYVPILRNRTQAPVSAMSLYVLLTTRTTLSRDWMLLRCLRPVWPDVGMKCSPNYPIVAQNLSTAGFTLCKLPKKQLNIWATFVRKFVASKFKKSPNLVTLFATFRLCCCCYCCYRNWWWCWWRRPSWRGWCPPLSWWPWRGRERDRKFVPSWWRGLSRLTNNCEMFQILSLN